jgi:hypothetical protein
VGLTWTGVGDDAIARTTHNVERLIEMARATPALDKHVSAIGLDEVAVGSRAPYLMGVAEGAQPVVVKINLSDVELAWAQAVARLDGELAPKVLATGVFPGTQITWLVQERLEHLVPTTRLGNQTMMEAAARLHLLGRTTSLPPGAPGGHPQTLADLTAVLESAVMKGAPPEAEELLRRARRDWDRLLEVAGVDWCHGDLHPGNVVRRTETGPGLLIGFHPRHAPWTFDAGWIAGLALVLDRRPLYRWLFDLLREARASVMGERLSDRDYELVVSLTAAWYAVICWSKRDDDAWADPTVRRLVSAQVSEALKA